MISEHILQDPKHPRTLAKSGLYQTSDFDFAPLDLITQPAPLVLRESTPEVQRISRREAQRVPGVAVRAQPLAPKLLLPCFQQKVFSSIFQNFAKNIIFFKYSLNYYQLHKTNDIFSSCKVRYSTITIGFLFELATLFTWICIFFSELFSEKLILRAKLANYSFSKRAGK